MRGRCGSPVSASSSRCAPATSCARSNELEDLARASHETLVGRLRLDVIPIIAPYLLPTIIGDLTRLHEGLDLHVRETLTQKLIQELADGRIGTVVDGSGSVFGRLRAGAAGRGQRQAGAKPVPSRKTLREMRLLLLEEGHCSRDQALSFCSMPSSRPRELLDGSSLSTLVQMVGAGIVVTLIPEMAVGVETRSASVSIAQFRHPRPSRTIGMVWRKTSPLAKQLKQISEVVRQSGETMRARCEPLPAPN